MTRNIVLLALGVLFAAPAHAWNARGHMTVAAVAWEKLTPAAKARATELLKLNPNYTRWTAGVDAQDRDTVAFVRAATWPDEIRSDNRYTDDGYTPPDASSGQSVGYSDTLLHRYWHFKDIPFSPDGTATE